ncbi:hypothetical protein JMJ77_0011561 [Colletotrichum scovillei]|uniref:Uncharacterized protein n=1 Tax=Colletotrichum scovillei TaxID=1209932 RepID=A0A9P7QW57_9PEZI|nr:hypothetical protein JMJ77_0011561 [Colletotrichum scovillei]KAG7045843.1 hypothetical protein JMJ78_0010914 [Colletotrichum scovillei]KAG7063187.1 hypothetical protein JMJ76_0005655 [Colletotrichum scovillei]
MRARRLNATIGKHRPEMVRNKPVNAKNLTYPHRNVHVTSQPASQRGTGNAQRGTST